MTIELTWTPLPILNIHNRRSRVQVMRWVIISKKFGRFMELVITREAKTEVRKRPDFMLPG